MQYKSIYELSYEIRVIGNNELWASETIKLASVDLYGAIQEANAIILRLKMGYGEAFEVRSFVHLEKNRK